MRIGPFDRDDPPPDRGRAGELDLAERAAGQGIRNGRPRKQRDSQATFHHPLRRLDVVDLGDAAWDDAGNAEQGVRHVVVTRRPVEQDELGVADLRNVDRARHREWVVRPSNQEELVLVERTAADPRVAELSDDPELDLAASHEIDDLLRMAGPNEQANVRVTLCEAHQDLRQNVGAHRRRNGERELASHAVFELADQRTTAADRVHRAVGMRQEGTTGGRQDHTRMRSPKEACAQFRLEPLEPGRERRLTDRESVGGTTHVPLPGDLDEPFDLSKQHDRTSVAIDEADHTVLNFRLDG